MSHLLDRLNFLTSLRKDTFADGHGLALRGGHHCNQPLMRKLGRPGTTRASFYVYNTAAEVDRMVEILHAACKYFG